MEIVYPKYIFTPSSAFKLYIVVQKIWIGYYEVIGLSDVIYHDFRPANMYYQDGKLHGKLQFCWIWSSYTCNYSIILIEPNPLFSLFNNVFLRSLHKIFPVGHTCLVWYAGILAEFLIVRSCHITCSVSLQN